MTSSTTSFSLQQEDVINVHGAYGARLFELPYINITLGNTTLMTIVSQESHSLFCLQVGKQSWFHPLSIESHMI